MDNKKRDARPFFLVAFGVLLFWGLQNLESIFTGLQLFMGLLMPLVVGLAIAFVVNVPMRFIEERLLAPLYRRLKFSEGLRRALALVVTLLLILTVIVLVVLIILPECVRTLGAIGELIPPFVEDLQRQLTVLLASYPQMGDVIADLEIDWNQLWNTVFGFVKNGAGSFLSSTVSIATSIFSGLLTFFLGLILAIYVLLQKEKVALQSKRLLDAFFPDRATVQILKVATLTERTFRSFLSGQCVEAVILGTMFFLSMSLLRLPYAMVISVAIGFLALIPIFGAVMGCVLGLFLITIVDPIQAIWFLVLFLVIQQVEGNLIYPKVVGSSVGLPSFWVLLAVTVGGSTMGVLGMLVFIPLCSVIYTLLGEDTQRRLAAKQADADAE